ncbi:MAG: hypothetical protein M0R33_15515 [Methylomonas sp.]|jgi:hypothetical protein|uniref:hypothetical protein n=1 Tax=Methylomonas sp. TaxID=418 RepID=UPI0025CC446F|nr:hypothetical protein [Methylomonas sp.]MCK9607851.1 hypothetical protein [Methylomonas sp.]
MAKSSYPSIEMAKQFSPSDDIVIPGFTDKLPAGFLRFFQENEYAEMTPSLDEFLPAIYENLGIPSGYFHPKVIDIAIFAPSPTTRELAKGSSATRDLKSAIDEFIADKDTREECILLAGHLHNAGHMTSIYLRRNDTSSSRAFTIIHIDPLITSHAYRALREIVRELARNVAEGAEFLSLCDILGNDSHDGAEHSRSERGSAEHAMQRADYSFWDSGTCVLWSIICASLRFIHPALFGWMTIPDSIRAFEQMMDVGKFPRNYPSFLAAYLVWRVNGDKFAEKWEIEKKISELLRESGLTRGRMRHLGGKFASFADFGNPALIAQSARMARMLRETYGKSIFFGGE